MQVSVTDTPRLRSFVLTHLRPSLPYASTSNGSPFEQECAIPNAMSSSPTLPSLFLPHRFYTDGSGHPSIPHLICPFSNLMRWQAPPRPQSSPLESLRRLEYLYLEPMDDLTIHLTVIQEQGTVVHEIHGFVCGAFDLAWFRSPSLESLLR